MPSPPTFRKLLLRAPVEHRLQATARCHSREACPLPCEYSTLKGRRSDPSIIHDEITVIDHALTRPWTVDKKYVLDTNAHRDWVESNCTEGSELIALGKEAYILRADGLLMPAKKDQPPPDLRYFKRRTK